MQVKARCNALFGGVAGASSELQISRSKACAKRHLWEDAIMAPASERRHRRNYNDPGHAHELTFSCWDASKTCTSRYEGRVG